MLTKENAGSWECAFKYIRAVMEKECLLLENKKECFPFGGEALSPVLVTAVSLIGYSLL